jgi:hypothetical protein
MDVEICQTESFALSAITYYLARRGNDSARDPTSPWNKYTSATLTCAGANKAHRIFKIVALALLRGFGIVIDSGADLHGVGGGERDGKMGGGG